MKSVAIGVTTLLTASAAWSQAYQLDDNELNVAAEHWPAWNFPAGSLDFSAEGVRPAFVREQVNASLDASAFTYADGVQGGIRNAGTNRAGAALILDGREDTFWEPDLADALDTWWVEIDLGRLVWAQKVVVKFAAEGAGDPFLQFKVLTANGESAIHTEIAMLCRNGKLFVALVGWRGRRDDESVPRGVFHERMRLVV